MKLRIVPWSGFALSCCAILLPFASNAQDISPVSRTPSLGRTQGSLPLWEKSGSGSIDQLTANARTLRDGIMLVGNPKGRYGTAFVISRKHRLLATNAHVGDIRYETGSMVAIRNDTLDTYKVTEVWYHPGVYRIGQNKKLVRSMDARDGLVFTFSPDVAVLQLAEEGPDLPQEFSLATWDEVKDLFALPLGMLGYPSHDTPDWPATGRKPVATFHHGVVARLTDFNQQPDVDERLRQYVQHTAASWPGFSGSPLFLPNGRVAAIHNCSYEVKYPNDPNRKMALQHGIRIDCLWELLAYHKLDRMLPIPGKKDEPRTPKTDADDRLKEAEDLLRAANKKRMAALTENTIRSAMEQIDAGKYREALDLCDEAIKLCPNHAGSYSTRAMACISIATSEEYRKLRLTNPRKRDMLLASFEAAKRYVELAPSDPEGYILLAHIVGAIELARNDELPAASKEWSDTRRMTSMLTQLLSAENLTPRVRTRALCKRGELRERVGESKEALDDFNEAIRHCPDHFESYRKRADYWEAHGKPDSATTDRLKARELEAKQQEDKFEHKIEGFFQQLEKEQNKK